MEVAVVAAATHRWVVAVVVAPAAVAVLVEGLAAADLGELPRWLLAGLAAVGLAEFAAEDLVELPPEPLAAADSLELAAAELAVPITAAARSGSLAVVTL
jgi:hypothetical protein